MEKHDFIWIYAANKSSKLKPWASKVSFIEMHIDFGKFVFLCGPKSRNNRLGRQDGLENIVFEGH